jgi:AcrR family transcriptional regulator
MAIDRRVARTRNALYDALVALIRERDYDTIRVEDILGRANVGRSTFYAHFKSKDELLKRSLERLKAELLSVLDQADTPDIGVVSRALFKHVGHHRDIYFSLSGKAAAEVLSASIATNFAQVAQSILPVAPRSAIPRGLAIAYIRETFLCVLRWWLERNPSVSPDEASSLFLRLVANGLADELPEAGDLNVKTAHPK